MGLNTDGLPADIAARMQELDKARVANGQVLLEIGPDGTEVFRWSLRDPDKVSSAKRTIEARGNTWRLATGDE